MNDGVEVEGHAFLNPERKRCLELNLMFGEEIVEKFLINEVMSTNGGKEITLHAFLKAEHNGN